jgi:hypothetical protein
MGCVPMGAQLIMVALPRVINLMPPKRPRVGMVMVATPQS